MTPEMLKADAELTGAIRDRYDKLAKLAAIRRGSYAGIDADEYAAVIEADAAERRLARAYADCGATGAEEVSL